MKSAWVEQFAAEIEVMKDYTRQLYGSKNHQWPAHLL